MRSGRGGLVLGLDYEVWTMRSGLCGLEEGGLWGLAATSPVLSLLGPAVNITLMHTQTHTHTHVRMYTRTHKHTHAQTLTHTHTHTHTHTCHIHTHPHPRTHTLALLQLAVRSSGLMTFCRYE